MEDIEGQVEDIDIDYPPSSEPYLEKWVSDRSRSPSLTSCSDDEHLVCSSMKKWPPLTESDIDDISNASEEQIIEPEDAHDQYLEKEGRLSGENIVQTSLLAEGLLEICKTEEEDSEIKTVTPSSQLTSR